MLISVASFYLDLLVFLVKFAAGLVSSSTLVLVVSLFYGSFTNFTMAIDCLK